MEKMYFRASYAAVAVRGYPRHSLVVEDPPGFFVPQARSKAARNLPSRQLLRQLEVPVVTIQCRKKVPLKPLLKHLDLALNVLTAPRRHVFK